MNRRALVALLVMVHAQTAQATPPTRGPSSVAARPYLTAWSAEGERACRRREAGCAGMDKVLALAAEALATAGRNSDAIAVYETLRDPRYHLDDTSLAHRAARAIGDLASNQGAFETAAAWFERFAAERVGADDGAESLARAGQLRLACGQPDKALSDAAMLRGHFPTAFSEGLSLTLAIADKLHASGEDPQAQALLEELLRSDEARASVGERIRIYTRMGRALQALREPNEAQRAYAKVIAAARTEGAWTRKPTETSPPHDWNQDVTDDAAEAFLMVAEDQRSASVSALPPYRGADDDLAAVGTYVRDHLEPWLELRTVHNEVLEGSYLRVFGGPERSTTHRILQAKSSPGERWAPWAQEPTPTQFPEQGNDGALPSRWRIVAAERIGAMWADLVSVSDRLPWHLADDHWTIAEARLRATQAFEKCYQLAVAAQSFDGTSVECERWLSHHKKINGLEELRPGLLEAPRDITMPPRQVIATSAGP